MASRPDTSWTTANVGEAMPGVQTALGWTFWRDACERAVRINFWRLGALRRAELPAPEGADDRFSGVFFGRAAGNVRLFREMGDRLPGTSADAVEEQIFGVGRTGQPSRPQYGRYPVAAVKLPAAAVQVPRSICDLRESTDRWWRKTVQSPPADLDAAVVVLRDAATRFEEIMGWHCLATMLAQGFYEQVERLALSASGDVSPLDLLGGYGDTEEVSLLDDLWRLAQGAQTVAAFLVRHGYHGPNEGELSSRSWREDPEPLLKLVSHYANVGEARRPRAVESAVAARRQEAEAVLLARLSRPRQAAARLLFRLARRYIPLREVGKAAFLQTIDAARLAARAAGRALVRAGDLEDAEDVFHLTMDELTSGTVPAPAVVAERRATRQRYLDLDLPPAWFGIPEPLVLGDALSGGVVEGLGVSAGIAEGTARVVTDAACGADLEPGEVLVCRATDPSWASIMFLASAMVVDVGGPMSHAAIVARELGVPCVINTGDGTRRLRSGDRLRVDGDSGKVEVL